MSERLTEGLIPEGESGAWRVEHFTVTEDDVRLHNMRCAWSPGMGRRGIEAGTYMRLMRGQTVVMSDTPAELTDLWEFRRRATGSILVNGLGLGIAVNMALAKPDVTDITVIERSADVLALVAPHISDPRLTIIEADAFEWQPLKGRRWNVVWHDIWDDICGDNLEGMKRLHRRYGRRCDWQGSWCRELCELNAA